MRELGLQCKVSEICFRNAIGIGRIRVVIHTDSIRERVASIVTYRRIRWLKAAAGSSRRAGLTPAPKRAGGLRTRKAQLLDHAIPPAGPPCSDIGLRSPRPPRPL